MARQEIALLVTDIDNTLFDWVSSWAACVPDLIDAVASQLGIAPAEAEQRILAVHRGWGLTECPSCVSEIIHDPDARDAIVRAYDAGFTAVSPVFDDVPAVLKTVRDRGARVAAYTESHRQHTIRRLELLGLADLVDVVYSDQRKPDPATLCGIAAEAGVDPRRVLYVGDNLWKDVAMAQRAGVHAAWARYGTRQPPAARAWLTRLCHWTTDDTAAEMAAAASVEPPIVLDHGLAELLELFDFVPHE